MLKRLLPTSLLIIMLAVSVACSIATPEGTTGVQEMTSEDANAATANSEVRGILRVPYYADDSYGSVYPASPVEFLNAVVLLYDRLVRLDIDGTLKPELATSWEANEEATEWTFTLRDDITFHDGTTFTSADVAYTIARILDPEVQASVASTLGLIERTETPDDQTIVFYLNQGHADFPLLVAHRSVGIIPEDSGDTIDTSGIGTGPFVLESLDAAATTVFRANDDYWKGTPKLAGIEVISMPDAEARSLAAQAGQIDVLLDASATQAALFESDADFTVIKYPSGRWTGLAMRTDVPPFDDARIRKALRVAANRDVMVQLVLDGEGNVSCDTPVMPSDAYRWEPECSQDIELAKSLLAEAGYPDGIDVTLYTSNIDSQLIPLAEVYQQQVAEAGINVSIQIIPVDSYFTAIWRVEPFFATYWTERPADQILNDNWRSTAQWNETFFNRSEFDQLLDDARLAIDFDERKQLYQDAQEFLFEEGGHLIPYHVNEFYIVNSKVSGMPGQSINNFEWHNISKSE